MDSEKPGQVAEFLFKVREGIQYRPPSCISMSCMAVIDGSTGNGYEDMNQPQELNSLGSLCTPSPTSKLVYGKSSYICG